MSHEEATTQGIPSPPNVFRGVLALLRDITQCNLRSRDEEELRNSKLLLRSRKRKPECRGTNATESIPVSLQDTLHKEFTMLFFFHPRQPHSITLRSTLSSFCSRNDDKISCLALFGGDPQAATKEDNEDINQFFHGTGFLEINLQEDEVGQRICTSLLKFLDITQIPAVVVVPNKTGRPIMGQEVALEWNGSSDEGENDAALFQRWRGGNSGLTLSQKAASAVLGDSNSVCLVM